MKMNPADCNKHREVQDNLGGQVETAKAEAELPPGKTQRKPHSKAKRP
jgi:hypothetical protein